MINQHKYILLYFLIGFSILFLRSSDAFLVPTFYAEDGVWLGNAISDGWVNAFINTRADYFVIGNLLILFISSNLSNMITGSEFLLTPIFIAIFSNIFFITVFYSCAAVIKSYLSISEKYKFTLFLLFVLIPLGDHSNEVLGRALQIGFFMPVLALNALLLSKKSELSKKSTISILILSLLTSPLSIIPIFVFYIKDIAYNRKLSIICNDKFKIIAYVSIFSITVGRIIYSAQNLIRAQSVEHVDNIIELFFARSILYPVIYPFYTHLNNYIVILLTIMLVLFFYGAVKKSSYLISVLIINILLMFTALYLTRPDITNYISGYSRTFPDRYFMTINLLAMMSIYTLILSSKPNLKKITLTSVIVLTLLSFNKLFDLNKPKQNFSKGQSFINSACHSLTLPYTQIPPGMWKMRVSPEEKKKLKCQ
ncbi:hypothetical protein [Aliivibrio logei]|uniref:Uncharacterized protein n=1 Tax=Aliivibrio logei 5S-186 TaxID=626086 RepID=A0ABX3AQT5_ALILO|nr:hypothetical protein [Aliivibrio logei]OEF10163.1 hypothetical protein A1Q5_13530 [Aliivibrio logei 5S-186]